VPGGADRGDGDARARNQVLVTLAVRNDLEQDHDGAEPFNLDG
jgi:hypothetical protein